MKFFAEESAIIHTGTVISSELNRNLVVTMLDSGDTVSAMYLPSFFGNMVGLRMHYNPAPGDRVVALYDMNARSTAIIIGSAPDNAADTSRVADGENYRNAAVNKRNREVDYPANGAPIDLVEGELLFTNEQGVLLSLLTNLCQLGAGPRAKLECLALGDMVRMLSENFAHHSGFGDHTIHHDQGKVWVEWHGTEQHHEANGFVNAGDPKLPLDERGAPAPTPQQDLDRELSTGRWRFSMYVGWLGDFINMFFSDPPKGLHKLMGVDKVQEDQLRAGKQRYAVGNDGSVLVQSVADIVLERVSVIPVPVRVASAVDPQRDTLSETPPPDGLDNHYKALREQLTDPPVADTWKPDEASSIHEAVYQLRHYARWLNTTLTLGRFLKLKSTFHVPEETDSPDPDLPDYIPVYSTIRIFRDGSQLLLDSYNNAVHLTKEGLVLSSPKRVRVESGADMVFVAGGRMVFCARKDISFTSLTSAVKIKAKETFLHIKETAEVLLQAAATYITGGVAIEKTLHVPEVDASTHVKAKVVHSVNKVHAPGKGVVKEKGSQTPFTALEHGGEPTEPADGVPVVPAEEVPLDSGDWYESLPQQGNRLDGEGTEMDTTLWKDGPAEHKCVDSPLPSLQEKLPERSALETPEPAPATKPYSFKHHG